MKINYVKVPCDQRYFSERERKQIFDYLHNQNHSKCRNVPLSFVGTFFLSVAISNMIFFNYHVTMEKRQFGMHGLF